MAKKRKIVDIPDGNVITIRNVYKAYDKHTPALNGISLDIKQGEFVFIVGDSGSGKSTLIKLLMRELKPTRGYVNVLGYELNTLPHRKIAKFRRNLGIVFQDFRLLKDRSIYENVAFAQRIIQIPNYRIRKNVPEILKTVGLANKYKNYPDQLSGGEQQRVALARALINKPFILLADEPTGNLDPSNTWEIMKLLEAVNNEGMTVLVVTHNREIVNAMHKRVITMSQGVITGDEEHGSYTRSENQAYEEEIDLDENTEIEDEFEDENYDTGDFVEPDDQNGASYDTFSDDAGLTSDMDGYSDDPTSAGSTARDLTEDLSLTGEISRTDYYGYADDDGGDGNSSGV